VVGGTLGNGSVEALGDLGDTRGVSRGLVVQSRIFCSCKSEGARSSTFLDRHFVKFFRGSRASTTPGVCMWVQTALEGRISLKKFRKSNF
jgi:hypothetical protein